MTPTEIALLVKPIVLPLFMFTLVAPVAWVLFRLFPNGRLKVALFKVRDGPRATRRDKVLMIVATLCGYGVLIAICAVVMRGP